VRSRHCLCTVRPEDGAVVDNLIDPLLLAAAPVLDVQRINVSPSINLLAPPAGRCLSPDQRPVDGTAPARTVEAAVKRMQIAFMFVATRLFHHCAPAPRAPWASPFGPSSNRPRVAKCGGPCRLRAADAGSATPRVPSPDAAPHLPRQRGCWERRPCDKRLLPHALELAEFDGARVVRLHAH
jgi:hypothetical protein